MRITTPYIPPFIPKQGATPPRSNAQKDGRAYLDPILSRVAKPATALASNVIFRKQVTGAENIPDGGGHLYCPTHQSELDLPLVSSVTRQRLSYMAAKEVFWGVPGAIMRNIGYFPVDRDSKDRFPLEHSKELLESGQPVLMCPEGKIFRDGKVHELKNGVAWLATRANFESVIPIAVNFEKGDASLAGPVEKAAGWLATGAVVAAGLWGSLGGPTARSLAGALAGGVAGAYVATRGNYGPDAFETMGRAVKGIAAGALTGAVAGASLPPGLAFPVLAATSLAAGVGMRQLANLFHSRPVAEIAVGKPLKIADYRERYGDQAGTYLRNDLHDFMATTKTQLSGIESPPAPAPTSRQAAGGGLLPAPAFRPPAVPAPALPSPAMRPAGEPPVKPD